MKNALIDTVCGALIGASLVGLVWLTITVNTPRAPLACHPTNLLQDYGGSGVRAVMEQKQYLETLSKRELYDFCMSLKFMEGTNQ